MEPSEEITADDRARVPLGKLGVRKTDRFVASRHSDGSIVLTPVVSVPKREMIVWDDDGLRASVLRGLADATEGKVRELDWATSD